MNHGKYKGKEVLDRAKFAHLSCVVIGLKEAEGAIKCFLQLKETYDGYEDYLIDLAEQIRHGIVLLDDIRNANNFYPRIVHNDSGQYKGSIVMPGNSEKGGGK